METGFEKPTGMRVRGAGGELGTYTFPEFVEAIQQGVIRAEDEVFSHIVTDGKWVPVGGLKVYRMVRGEPRTPTVEPPVPEPEALDGTVWPPPPGVRWG